jgi:hypothetical protein
MNLGISITSAASLRRHSFEKVAGDNEQPVQALDPGGAYPPPGMGLALDLERRLQTSR